MSKHMRTTVRLAPDLMRAAKLHASATGRTLTALIEDALRLAMSSEGNPRPRMREALPTYGSGGAQPGVDLDRAAGPAGA